MPHTEHQMYNIVLYQSIKTFPILAVSELATTARATARFPHHHALTHRTSLATAVAVAVAANFDMALYKEVLIEVI